MEVSAKNLKTNKEVSKVTLNETVWNADFNQDLVAQALYVYNSNQRRSNAAAKTRAQVSGGGRKPHKQKGTGRARAGSNTSPLWVGGGVTFVPSGRNWSRKLNKKMKMKAFAAVLSERLRKEALNFVEIESETKAFRDEIANATPGSVLVISGTEGLYLSVRNVAKTNVLKPELLNIFELINADLVLVDVKSLDKLEEMIANEK